MHCVQRLKVSGAGRATTSVNRKGGGAVGNCTSVAVAAQPARGFRALGASFEHGVEGSRGHAAEPCKASRSHHLSDPRLPGLRAQRQADFLG